MHLRGNRHMPRPPAIAVDALHLLLVDVPSSWQLISDVSARFVVIDEDGNPRGYLDINQPLVVLLDLLSAADRDRLMPQL